MVRAMRKVQIKCYGGSAEGEIPVVGRSGGGFMKDVVSAWASKEPEESVPGDENSKTKGTETGKPDTPSRNDGYSRWTGTRCKGRMGLYWMVCNVRTKTCTLF